MISEWKIQIANIKTGEVAHAWQPGLAVEHEFIETLIQKVLAKGVGVGKSEDHVADDIRLAFAELLLDLKRQV